MTARARAKRDAPNARKATPHIVREVLRTPGEELDTRARDWMEPRFGHDFGHVRVHRDDRAAEAAESIGAQAFTAGRHVVFGAGRYTAPVLAHELSHVTPHEHDVDALRVGDAHDPEETRAESNVARIASFAGGASPLPNAAGDGAPVIRRLSRAATVGLAAGIAAAVVGVIVGLATQSVGLGILGGAIAGGLVALIALAATRSSASRRRPVGRHLAVALDVNFVPTGQTPATVTQLPADTRVIREAAPAGAPPAPANHVHVRVTTGPLLGATGWVDEGALIERTNTEVLTPDDAARLWRELSQATFLTASGERMPIPFHYPVDGCYARAQRMDEILLDAGYESERVFIVSRAATSSGPAGLRVQSEYGNEAPGETPSVSWWYHVAPIVRVQAADGTVERIVLDPSMTSGPLTIADWSSRMGHASSDFREVTLEEFREGMASGSYEENVFFIAPGGTYTPMNDTPPPGLEPGPILSQYAREAQTRDLVRTLRGLANDPNSTIEQVLAAIGAASTFARHDLVDTEGGEGSQTLAALRTKFGASGYARIDAALRAP